jgi:3',5'-nucleoside bisphosphate phosphatase
MIDLHTHSTCSDGTLSPTELVREAKKSGLTHLSLTDHDTAEGVAEARAEAGIQGLSFMGGLEISAEHQPGTLHVLGYGFDESDAALSERLEYVRRCRAERNPKIAENLRALGMDVRMEEVKAVSGHGLVGRPHFAKVLLDKGYVPSLQEAFDRYLAKGRPAYVDKVRLSPEESLAVIREAGGVAVLAHPLQLKVGRGGELEAVVKRLADLGLQGMECYYRNHSAEDTEALVALARTCGLVATGGSDFHGANRPGIRLGIGEGGLRVPIECWEDLRSTIGRTFQGSEHGHRAP